MTTSFTKKFEMDIKFLKKQSDMMISPDKFYLINIKLNTDVPESAVKDFLYSEENQPSVIYIHRDTLWLIFSCLQEGETHFEEGSHQKITSRYFNTFFNLYQSVPKMISIVEFETQTQLISYFLWEIYQNSKQFIIDLSEGEITETDMIYNTSFEIFKKLKSKVVWDDLSKSERYGTFYKLRKAKSGIKVVSFSESHDSRHVKKYSNFLTS
jgi:hypothetical protein